ncbi:MAG: hypothetical protein ACR2OR_04940 [Hyphomicrobiales bacterium]
MKLIFDVIALIAMLAGLMSPTFAETYTCQNGTKTDLGKIADAKTLLDAQKYETYSAMLAKKDCDSAASILNKAFISRYPELSFAREAESGTYLEWKHTFSEENYVEMTFCFTVNDLEALEKVRKSGEAFIGRYHSRDRPPNDNKNWEDRDWNIIYLTAYADDGHLLALIYLGQLARQGDIFEDSEEAEFFIFSRACANNFRCSENLARFRELEKKLKN